MVGNNSIEISPGNINMISLELGSQKVPQPHANMKGKAQSWNRHPIPPN